MADEIRVSSSLQIRSGNLNYQSQPTAFTADLTGVPFGPTPGAMKAPYGGAAADLSRISMPGLCRLMNIDSLLSVEWGIRDPGINVFYPVGLLMPGETYVLRLTPNLLEEYAGTGTGTTGPGNQLWFRSTGGPGT